MLIFNFHHVEKPIRHPSRKHISISPEGLRRFIRTLRLLGLEIVSLRDVLNEPARLQSVKRQVALTFDDGYVNNLEQALPILEAEQCPATVFVLPGRLGGTNEWDQSHLPEAERDRLMTLEEMRTLAQSPWVTLGSHGLLHSDFTRLTSEERQHELQESYRFLSEHFGDDFLPVFAYPWGYYSDDVIGDLEKSPYRYAFTVETARWRPSDCPFKVPRYTVYFRDGNPLILLAKLCRHGVFLD
ncbi:MAG TPA: polysaccharide deacetylase family protein [Oculatellaceae cyanobacterium]